jgi:hypothetical protein
VVGILEKMSTNVTASAQPTFHVQSAVLNHIPSPLFTASSSVNTEKVQCCSSRIHHTPPNGLESAGSGACSVRWKAPGQVKVKNVVLCSSNGKNGSARKHDGQGKSNGAASGKRRSASTAVVWYKRDLRLDDHLGLMMAASSYEKVLPLYVFDPELLSGMTCSFLLHLTFSCSLVSAIFGDFPPNWSSLSVCLHSGLFAFLTCRT